MCLLLFPLLLMSISPASLADKDSLSHRFALNFTNQDIHIMGKIVIHIVHHTGCTREAQSEYSYSVQGYWNFAYIVISD